MRDVHQRGALQERDQGDDREATMSLADCLEAANIVCSRTKGSIEVLSEQEPREFASRANYEHIKDESGQTATIVGNYWDEAVWQKYFGGWKNPKRQFANYLTTHYFPRPGDVGKRACVWPASGYGITEPS